MGTVIQLRFEDAAETQRFSTAHYAPRLAER
jgi:hypothetical protein